MFGLVVWCLQRSPVVMLVKTINRFFPSLDKIAMSERGSVASEAALAVPILELFVICVIDGALFCMNGELIGTVAQESVLYASGLEDLEEGTFNNLTSDSAPQFRQRQIQKRAYQLLNTDTKINQFLDPATISVTTTYNAATVPNNITVTISANFRGFFYFFRDTPISVTAKGDSVVS